MYEIFGIISRYLVVFQNLRTSHFYSNVCMEQEFCAINECGGTLAEWKALEYDDCL